MENTNHNGKGRLTVTVVAIIATFLLMGFLVKQMVKVTQPPPVNAARSAERAAELARVRAESAEAARTWGHVDAARGIVRLPLDQAIKITVQGYQQPAEFRSNLLGRVEKLSAAPKNEYE